MKFFNDDTEAAVPSGYEGVAGEDFYYPRENFNKFLFGFVVIFIVFIGEDWNSCMYNAYRTVGAGAYIYFISLFIIGNLILLNLFLAILLKNFEEPPGAHAHEEDAEIDKSKPKVSVF